MKDVVALAIIAAFFALCVAYVWWCDRIIGTDADNAIESGVDDEQVATTEDVLAS